ncbi:hypothetical protein HanIR_Chr03g0116931 [Helianthus annuus]|nr:hypothetical protein HanIR_Chr03g0116931 [Helianthus annuus]
MVDDIIHLTVDLEESFPGTVMCRVLLKQDGNMGFYMSHREGWVKRVRIHEGQMVSDRRR